MTLIQFVQNYEDLSTDKGYQFKFHCDKCGNGYMTRFHASAIGIAESVLQVAGNVFGGFMGTLRNSAYEVQRAIGGPAHDAALEEAVREGKEHFHQCTRCGQWVCPEVCWNTAAGLCERCAPKFEEEFAAQHAQAKAQAAAAQLREKAAHTDFASGMDMSANVVAAAPGVAPAGHCTGCGGSLAAGARFCPQCGAARVDSACPSCHAPVPPGAKFCAGCGAKVG
jgi:hypothetical protein